MHTRAASIGFMCFATATNPNASDTEASVSSVITSKSAASFACSGTQEPFCNRGLKSVTTDESKQVPAGSPCLDPRSLQRRIEQFRRLDGLDPQ